MDELFEKRELNHFSSSKLGLNKCQYNSEKKPSLKHHCPRVNHRARIPMKIETTKHEQKFHQFCTTSRENPHSQVQNLSNDWTVSTQNLPYLIKFPTTPNGDKSTNQENQYMNNKCNHPSTSNTQHETDIFQKQLIIIQTPPTIKTNN